MPRAAYPSETPAFIAARMAVHVRAQEAREAELRLLCTDPVDRMICEGLGAEDRLLALQLVAAGTHSLDAAIEQAWAAPGRRWIPRGTTKQSPRRA